jgi:hypothetical protein
VAPLQTLKTALLKGAPLSGRARKQYAAHTPVQADATLQAAFDDLKQALANRPRLNHLVDGQPIYAFLDSSREYGSGLAVYQLTGDPDTYSKTRLVPLHFMSLKLSPAEENYWPTDMEMSGLVWAVKTLRSYMERAYVWFVTDHKPNFDIFDMKSLVTTSTSRSNLRLQTWGIYLSQFWGRMSVLYSKGSKIDCPDALSRLRYDLSERSAAFRDWAARLGKEPDTAEFEVTEAFAITRSSRQRQVDNAPREINHEDDGQEAPSTTVEATLATADDTEHDDVGSIASAEKQPPSTATPVALSIEISADYKTELQQAVQNSSRFVTIHDRLITAEKTIIDGQDRHELPETCQYILQDGVLYYVDPVTRNYRLVLASRTLQKKHLLAAHTSAHLGYARMADDLQPYYWPKMSHDIRLFLRHCPDCQRNKPANHKPFGLLSPIPTPAEPFDTWSIDLRTDLPPCKLKNVTITYDTVMTVTDKYSKAVRFLPGRKDWSAADWAEAIHEGVSLNGWGFLRTIISDRDKRFLSALWDSLLEGTGVKHITTTAYHPSADGQAERTNFTLEVALRYFVNETQDNWASKLKVIEALLNNTKSSTTGKAPNALIYGKRVRLDLTTTLSEVNPEADTVAEQRQQNREEALRAIAFAQKAMKHHYDKSHQLPDFKEGWAFLRLGNGYSVPGIPKAKIGPQRIGPFRILDTLSKGRAYRLEFPPHFQIHDVISVTHLEPSPCPRADPYARTRPVTDLAPVYAHDNGDEEWELDALVGKRVTGKGNKRRTQYLARWKGHGPEWDRWYDEAELENAQDLVMDYEKTLLEKEEAEILAREKRGSERQKKRRS